MEPPKLEWGPKKLRAFINEKLIPWCRSGRPLRTLDCEIDEREDGTLIFPRSTAGLAGAAEEGQLQIFDASDGSTPKIRVTDGQIYSGASWTPYLAGDPISTDPAPTLTVSGTDVVIYAKLILDSATGIPTAAADVLILAGASIPTNDSTHAYIKLADIVVTTGAAASVAREPAVSGSLTHQRCRDWFSSEASYTQTFGSL
jgi:hypothetical protein